MNKQLSSRALKLLERVKAGVFYPVEGRIPKAMAELEAAKLVTTCGRVVVIKRCFVPIGFRPHREERLPK